MSSNGKGRIWKYELALTERQTITMRSKAKVLSVQVQNETICMWTLVDITEKDSKREFVIVGTGRAMPDDALLYHGTVQMGAFVWHVFEKVAIKCS